MHGLGNDFVVVDAVSQAVSLAPEIIKGLADRHYGIGFDQLLIVEPPLLPKYDFRYRIFNADGGEVENCGNGARCFARFVRERQLTSKDEIRVQTAAGSMTLTAHDDATVSVDMGAPVLTPEAIPFVAKEQQARYTLSIPLASLGRTSCERLEASLKVNLALGARLQGDTLLVEGFAVSMGNPHFVLQVNRLKDFPVDILGPLIETHEAFPKGVNVGFMRIVDRSSAKLRVFERGVGETIACGTGACAAAVAGISAGALDSQAAIELPGGKLFIEWKGDNKNLIMRGPAERVFDGSIDL